MSEEKTFSKTEYMEWLSMPITEEVFKQLTEIRDATKDHLMSGGTLADDPVKETARAVGIIEGLELFLNLDLGDE
jgi:hypothetical protein